MKEILIGSAFALLWASASTATKFGLQSGEPFVLTNIRFALAAALMLLWAHVIRRLPLPSRPELWGLLVYGMLNCSIYLGVFSWAMRYATAGIGTLSVALNPLLISLFSAVVLKKTIESRLWWGLFLGIAGVGVATYPVLLNSSATPLGIALLFGSMLSYSMGTVYFSGRAWEMDRVVINGWQILFGALTLLPVTLLFTQWERQHFDAVFWGSVWWLTVPVSIGAVQLWLRLLQMDPVKAALWLFLCPILGFIYAHLLLQEALTVYTAAGTALVIVGLYLGQRRKA